LQKRQTPEKGFALNGKRYHNQLKRCQNIGYIAGIKGVDNKKYRFLASTTGSSISASITYIVFLTKLQKRQTLEKGFALI
jgi:hypothetical protein